MKALILFFLYDRSLCHESGNFEHVIFSNSFIASQV